MNINSIFFVFFLFICGCGTKTQSEIGALGLMGDKISSNLTKVPDNISYTSNCLDDGTGISQGIDFLNTIKREGLNVLGVQISDADQNEYGDNYHEELKNSGEWNFSSDSQKIKELEKMLEDLLSTRNSPSSIEYSIYLLESEIVNAFTVGGHIYITTGIIEYANTESEIAFVIGHEIGHNERGHIKTMLQELATAQNFAGDFGTMAASLQQFLTPSFNQPNEIEADFYGADLVHAAGYDACKGIQMWKRMSEKEGNYNMFANFLRSHPYSIIRFDCLKQHNKEYYNLDCE